MGETLRKELPPGHGRARAHERRLAEGNARSAMTSPNWGPHMGFIRLALARPGAAPALAARDRGPDRATILEREVSGRRVPAVAGRPRRERVLERLPRAARRRGPRRQPRTARRRKSKAVAEVARTVPGIRDIYPTLQLDYPEVRVETDREEAGARRRDRARRGADDARGDARQHQHAERLDRRRATASRTTSSRRTTPTQLDDPERAGAASRCASTTAALRSRSARTARSRARPARSRSSATSSRARRTC